ncbi:hypothetical protein SeMB42_g05308 [Synchytrium endobioticum]|uniref:F-box domain-containing protein n=1 Tax=Synchytrium endobioticum TaxID=286115 RepID=A0A507CSH2_9FUNG|nr:hypothetical protein SeMB42_g05308 [Synchytrium endobioticum]
MLHSVTTLNKGDSVKPTQSLSALADEILLLVAAFLASNASAISRLARTSRRFGYLLDDDFLWKELCHLNGFAEIRTAPRYKPKESSPGILTRPRPPPPAPPTPPHGGLQGWKRVFMNNLESERKWKRGDCTVSDASVRHDVQGGASLCLWSNSDMAVSTRPDGVGQVWSVDTGRTIHTLAGHSGPVSVVRCDSANNYIVTGSTDRTVRIWSGLTGECDKVLAGHAGEIVSMDLGRGARGGQYFVASGSEDATARIWTVEDGTCITVLRGHAGAVTCLQLDDDRLFTGSADSTIKIWNWRQGTCTTLQGHAGYVFCLKYSNGKLVTGGADSTIRLWNLENGNPTSQVLFGHESCVVCVSYDGEKIISGSTDTTIRVWDAKNGACLYSLAQHGATVWSLHATKTPPHEEEDLHTLNTDSVLPNGSFGLSILKSYHWASSQLQRASLSDGGYSSELRGDPMYQKTRAKLGLSEPEVKGKSW